MAEDGLDFHCILAAAKYTRSFDFPSISGRIPSLSLTNSCHDPDGISIEKWANKTASVV
jgi:hypothetical protein